MLAGWVEMLMFYGCIYSQLCVCVCVCVYLCMCVRARVVYGVLPLIVRPSSTPLFLGSLTWKVPLLGTTDSIQTNTHLHTHIIYTK